jgi:hypothetical protein
MDGCWSETEAGISELLNLVFLKTSIMSKRSHAPFGLAELSAVGNRLLESSPSITDPCVATATATVS